MMLTDHQIKPEFVGESAGSRGRELSFDVKTAGGEDDGKGEPETTVGRERSGTECVANRHFPVQGSSALSLESLARD